MGKFTFALLMSLLMFSAQAFAVLKVKFDTSQITVTDIKGKASHFNVEDDSPVEDTGEIRTDAIGRNSDGGYIIKKVTLYDSGDSVIKEISGNPTQAVGADLIAGATAGDNGSSASTIKWTVDTASFATGKIVYELAGRFGDPAASRMRIFSSGSGSGKWVQMMKGSGVMTVTLPFTTVDE